MIIFLIAQKFGIVSDVLKYFLEREGYATETTIDIKDGLKNQRQKKGLILIAKLDLRAKGLTSDIINQLHKLSSTMNTTVIGVSNGDSKDKINVLFKNCGAKYIIKYPFNILGLLEIIRKNHLPREKRNDLEYAKDSHY